MGWFSLRGVCFVWACFRFASRCISKVGGDLCGNEYSEVVYSSLLFRVFWFDDIGIINVLFHISCCGGYKAFYLIFSFSFTR